MSSNHTMAPLLFTRKQWDSVVAWLFLAACFITASVFIGRLAFRDVYPDLYPLLVSLLLFSAALFTVAKSLAPFQVIAYADRLELKSVWPKFDRIIFWADISTWSEIEIKGKQSVVQKIVFKAGKCSLKLSSSVFDADYFALFMLFKKYAGEPEVLDETKVPTGFIAGMAIAGVLITLGGCHTLSRGSDPISDSSVVYISGPMAYDGVVYKSGKGRRDISISLSTLPDWRFNFDQDAFAATDQAAYVSGVRKGDTIQLTIDKSEYHKKLAGDMPLTFSDKVVDYRIINVFAVRDRKQSYLTLEGYNNERGDTTLAGFALALGAIVLLGALGVLIHKLRQ